MSKLTQRELLSEGFWDKFKTVAKTAGKVGAGVVGGVAKAVDTVLPELTKPFHDVKSGVKKIAGAAESGYKDSFNSRLSIIKKKLEQQGYQIADDKTQLQKLGKHLVVFANQVIDFDKKTGKFIVDKNKTIPFIVDKDNELRKAPNISAQKPKTPPTEEPPPLPPQTQGGTPPPTPPVTTPQSTPQQSSTQQAQQSPPQQSPAAQAQPQPTQAPVQPPTNTSTTSPSVSAAPRPTLRPVSSPTARRTP